MMLGFVVSAIVTTGTIVVGMGVAVVTTVVPIVASVVVNATVGTVRMGYGYFRPSPQSPQLPTSPTDE